MAKARRKELFQYGITPVEASALFTIQAIGYKVTAAEIARWLLREPHSVSSLLARMEKKGLVRKIKDLEKKNLIRIMLTQKGRQAYYRSTKRESINRIMSCLSTGEHQQLRAYAEKLWYKALEDLGIRSKQIFPPAK